MRDDDEEITVADEDEAEGEAGSGRGGSFAAGIAVGVLLGAAVALLFAPDRGRVTREKLRRRLDDARDYATEEFGDLKKRARKELRRRMG